MIGALLVKEDFVLMTASKKTPLVRSKIPGVPLRPRPD